MDRKHNLVVIKEKATPKTLAIAGGIAAGITVGGLALVKLLEYFRKKKLNDVLEDIAEDEDLTGPFTFTKELSLSDGMLSTADVIYAIQLARDTEKQVKLCQDFGKDGKVILSVDVGANEELVSSYMDFEGDPLWKHPHWEKAVCEAEGFPTLTNYLFFCKCDKDSWIILFFQGLNVSEDAMIKMEDNLDDLTAGVVSTYPEIFSLCWEPPTKEEK